MNWVELYEYKVMDLQEGRTPKGGMRSILALRDQLLGAPLEGIIIGRFRRMDRLFKDFRIAAAAVAVSIDDDEESPPIHRSSVRDLSGDDVPILTTEADDNRVEDQDEEALALRGLSDKVWTASLEDEMSQLAEKLRREPAQYTLRAVYALLENAEAYSREAVGKTDPNLMKFKTQVAVAAAGDPLLQSERPEMALEVVRRVLDAVLNFDKVFKLEIAPTDRLPYLRRMATLIIERPFVGRASHQRNLSSSEMRQAIESARAEQMSASSRADLIVRLQNQLDSVLTQEMAEKRELEHEQGMLRQAYAAFFDMLKSMLPDSYGGTAGTLIPSQKVLYAQNPGRRLLGEPEETQSLTLRLTRAGGAQVGPIYLSWGPQPGGGWMLEVGGAEYPLLEERNLKIPLEVNEVRVFRLGLYVHLQVQEGSGESLSDLLRLARATAALLESGGEYFNLRLSRGVAAWVRDGRIDLGSIAPDSAVKYGNVPLDTLFSFARKGAESLVNRFKKLPREMVEDSFGEVARLMGERGGKERARYVQSYFEDMNRENRSGVHTSAIVAGSSISNPGQVVVLAYRGEPLTVDLAGRALTVRSDYKGDLTVVAVGQPSENVGDILVYQVGDDYAVLARQGLRLAVSLHRPML